MKDMTLLDKTKYGLAGKRILDDLNAHPEKKEKLITVLTLNGFVDIARILKELDDKYNK